MNYFLVIALLTCFFGNTGVFVYGKCTTAPDPLVVLFPVIDLNDSVGFDFSRAVCYQGLVEVPVYFTADDAVYAMDFSMKFDPSVFSYHSYLSHKPYMNNSVNFHANDSTLRFTSFSMVAMESDSILVTLRFSVPGDMIGIGSFNSVDSWLNGDACSVKSVEMPPIGPILAAGPPVITSGDSLLLKVVPVSGYTFTWSTGASDDSIYVSVSGTYSVIFTNSSGCTLSSSITVSVLDPLPVELIDFYVSQVDDDVLLEWTTAGEIDLSHFLVQRSSNGMQYMTVAKVPARGAHNGHEHYNVLDSLPNDGPNLYRLVQYKLDGNFNVLGTLGIYIIKQLPEEQRLTLFPNPVVDRKLTLKGSGRKPADRIEALVYDRFGRKVCGWVLIDSYSSSAEFERSILLPESIIPGLYWLLITGFDKSVSASFVVLKSRIP